MLPRWTLQGEKRGLPPPLNVSGSSTNIGLACHGEELAIFPLVDNVAPWLQKPIVKDHRGLDFAYDTLSKSYSAHDLLQTARATAWRSVFISIST